MIYFNFFWLILFSDPAVHALQFLDVINMKDPTQKAHFYRSTLKDALPFIPRVNNFFFHFSHLKPFWKASEEMKWRESKIQYQMKKNLRASNRKNERRENFYFSFLKIFESFSCRFDVCFSSPSSITTQRFKVNLPKHSTHFLQDYIRIQLKVKEENFYFPSSSWSFKFPWNTRKLIFLSKFSKFHCWICHAVMMLRMFT